MRATVKTGPGREDPDGFLSDSSLTKRFGNGQARQTEELALVYAR
jgi:hypothetical protein